MSYFRGLSSSLDVEFFERSIEKPTIFGQKTLTLTSLRKNLFHQKSLNKHFNWRRSLLSINWTVLLYLRLSSQKSLYFEIFRDILYLNFGFCLVTLDICTVYYSLYIYTVDVNLKYFFSRYISKWKFAFLSFSWNFTFTSVMFEPLFSVHLWVEIYDLFYDETVKPMGGGSGGGKIRK